MDIIRNLPLLNAPTIKGSEASRAHSVIPSKPVYQKDGLSSFVNDIRSDNVSDVLVKSSNRSVYYMNDDGSFHVTKYIENNALWRIMLDSHANVMVDPTEAFGVQNVFSIVFMTFLFISLFRLVTGTGNGPINLNNKLKIETNITTRFSDVQGIDEAKNELEQIVGFLRAPEKYTQSGARIPKGAMLIGSPGTGKTLLARAIAGESSVPFIQISGSSFVELFVGMGAKRVRDLFAEARKVQPCIIFIDEIDAIGKQRSSGGFASNDEREQTVNQLLTEMDGFNKDSKIVVIAATNRVDILDKALLRPGRFDRKINVRLPEIKGRAAILTVHSKNKKFDKSVKLSDIAKQTTGFSGADLENLMNECAIKAANENDGVITSDIVEQTYSRIVIGEKSNKILSLQTKRRIACHEAGHAIVGVLMPDYELVRKVSIVPRGETGGVTFFQPRNDDMKMYTREYLLSQIKVALAGHAAEELFFNKNNVSTGASGDFTQVYSVAKEMITTFGFGNIGKINVNPNDMSTDMSNAVDKEIQEMVENCYSQTIELLTKHRLKLSSLTDKLIEEEIVDGQYVYDMFR